MYGLAVLGDRKPIRDRVIALATATNYRVPRAISITLIN